jgi:hypothetical protein
MRMDNIQVRNEAKSHAVVRYSYSHTLIEHKLQRREAIDSFAEVVSIRMAWTENIDLMAFSP